MTSPTENADVTDVPAEHRFVARVDGHEAELVYRLAGDRLTLVHTEVPEALGGRGLGGHLVRAALDRARREGLTVVPWCPFARRWLREHEDEATGVTIDWRTPPPNG
jgi:predicted GNAT family acetyltransferase